VRHFNPLRIALPLVVGAVALLWAPACKAQSEVSPDHFDGTDSWAAAAQAPHPVKLKHGDAVSTLQTQARKLPQTPPLQLASSREASKPARRDASAVDRKHKPALRDPEKK